MTPFSFGIFTFLISLCSGILGALLGIGGGVVIIPSLTLIFGIDIRYAIGASIVAVVATSSGAAAAYPRERMVNVRVALLLELATTSGAISGAYLAGHVATRWLYVVFAVMMAFTAAMMLRRHDESADEEVLTTPWAEYLRLHGSYFDAALGREVSYRAVRARAGLALMYLAGVVSGLLGIGSGALKVPAMDLVMRLPLKASSATSNFMIGVTACASAGIYFLRGDIDPFVAAPVALGVVLGAVIGSRLLGRVKSRSIRIIFVVVLFVVALQMFLKGVRS